jgi:hypothetical protein
MFCTNCGKDIGDVAKFCKYCGKPAVSALYVQSTTPNVPELQIPLEIPASPEPQLKQTTPVMPEPQILPATPAAPEPQLHPVITAAPEAQLQSTISAYQPTTVFQPVFAEQRPIKAAKKKRGLVVAIIGGAIIILGIALAILLTREPAKNAESTLDNRSTRLENGDESTPSHSQAGTGGTVNETPTPSQTPAQSRTPSVFPLNGKDFGLSKTISGYTISKINDGTTIITFVADGYFNFAEISMFTCEYISGGAEFYPNGTKRLNTVGSTGSIGFIFESTEPPETITLRGTGSNDQKAISFDVADEPQVNANEPTSVFPDDDLTPSVLENNLTVFSLKGYTFSLTKVEIRTTSSGGRNLEVWFSFISSEDNQEGFATVNGGLDLSLVEAANEAGMIVINNLNNDTYKATDMGTNQVRFDGGNINELRMDDYLQTIFFTYNVPVSTKIDDLFLEYEGRTIPLKDFVEDAD